MNMEQIYSTVGKITVTIILGFVANYIFNIWLTAKKHNKKSGK